MKGKLNCVLNFIIPVLAYLVNCASLMDCLNKWCLYQLKIKYLGDSGDSTYLRVFIKMGENRDIAKLNILSGRVLFKMSIMKKIKNKKKNVHYGAAPVA